MIPVVKRISHLIKTGNHAHLKSYLDTMHPADIAAAIALFRPEDILRILEIIGNARSIEIFSELEPDTQKACIEYTKPEQVLHYFEALSPDDQTDLLKKLRPEDRETFLSLLKGTEREGLIELSLYEEGTAGAEMTTEVFSLPSHMSAAQAIEEIKRKQDIVETIYTIYITNDCGRLEGVVTLKGLVLASPEKELREIMNPNVVSVTTTEPVETVAAKIAKYDLLAVPVVGPGRILVGIITVDDVVDIIEEQATEDIYAMGAAGAPIDYMTSGVLRISRQRITWLLALVVTGFVAGLVLELFAKELAAYVQLAFFIPLLNGSGGNAGTQTTTVIVRGLATGEVTPVFMAQVLWKEIRIGIIVGLVMAIFAGARAVLLNHDWFLALTVGSSMILIVTFAKTFGSVIPILFKRLKLDPAVVSGPLLASLVDIFSLCIYLGLAKLFLPGI